jgi:hypothetical protein
MFNKAIDYCNANGGRKIIIPRPYQIEHTLHPILSSNVFFEGLGGELSKITFISDTEDLFTVGINDGGSQIVRRIEFEKIYFSHNSTKTAGVTIKCLQSQKVLLKDILYGNAFTFVQLGYDGDGVSNFVVIDNAIGTHVGNSKCVDIQGCSGIHLIKVQANNEYNGTAIKFPTTGSMDTLFIDNCLFQRFNYGLTALCSAGVTQNVFANALVIDGCALNAMLIKPTGTGIVTRFHFDTSWFYSRDNEGIVISKGASDGETDGIHFDTCRVLKSGKTGVDIQRGKNISFSGKSIISGNSHLGSGLYDGVNIGSATENVSIVGATIGNEGQMINNQRYGINVAPGANNYMITNNILRGNVTSGLYEPTPGANRVVTNNLV